MKNVSYFVTHFQAVRSQMEIRNVLEQTSFHSCFDLQAMKVVSKKKLMKQYGFPRM